MIDQEQKREIVNKFHKHTLDTGSPEVQVAIMTARIEQIGSHLRSNKKDKAAARGLRKLVSRRHRLLRWLLEEDPQRYSYLIKELSIRG